MLQVEYTNQFKKDLKLSKKRHKNLNRLHEIMTDIEKQKSLDHKLKDHRLAGN
jgi:mRNA interferase YafQ